MGLKACHRCFKTKLFAWSIKGQRILCLECHIEEAEAAMELVNSLPDIEDKMPIEGYYFVAEDIKADRDWREGNPLISFWEN